MDNPRLLTEQNDEDSAGPFPSQLFLKDYGDQIAKAVHAATLRAVGEAFEARSFVVTSNILSLDNKTAVYLEQSDLTDLRNGQWPAGWERKE